MRQYFVLLYRSSSNLRFLELLKEGYKEHKRPTLPGESSYRILDCFQQHSPIFLYIYQVGIYTLYTAHLLLLIQSPQFYSLKGGAGRELREQRLFKHCIIKASCPYFSFLSQQTPTMYNPIWMQGKIDKLCHNSQSLISN